MSFYSSDGQPLPVSPTLLIAYANRLNSSARESPLSKSKCFSKIEFSKLPGIIKLLSIPHGYNASVTHENLSLLIVSFSIHSFIFKLIYFCFSELCLLVFSADFFLSLLKESSPSF